MKYSNKIAVRNLVEICANKGVKHVVISPGSRNAPFSISFNRHPEIETTVIVDERSAAFYALGIAQQTDTTVAIVCTSGTASLNYAPAIAEAYYQKIPLLVITADRPAEWIDQMDGQTIRQDNIYNNYVKKSFTLPTDPVAEDEVWYAERMCVEAIESTYYPESGPVHINVPMREPLYEERDYDQVPLPKDFSTVTTALELPSSEIGILQEEWKKAKKILIVSGLLKPNETLNNCLEEIAKLDQVAVLTETTSNLYGSSFNRSIDRLLVGIEEKNSEDYQADLLITLGGPVVSKKLKAFLRHNPPLKHWHINASNDYTDTYKSLSRIIPVGPSVVLPSFTELNTPSNYGALWNNLDDQLLELFKSFMLDVPFSDLKVFDQILQVIPEGSQLQLANSTAVRYSNLFDRPANMKLKCFSNRGTSGIDGTISTAVGAAKSVKEICTVVTGDLSFFYDSNALWINPLPSNLKIIVINNQGGNIFRIIEGPNTKEELSEYFEANHQLNAEGICSTFGVNYLKADSSDSLEKALTSLYAQKEVSLLEIFTSNEITPKILKDYFDVLKKA